MGGESSSSIQHHHHHNNSRLGLRSTMGGVGEIVEVQGGHIVRSTGRKDRHSKVCTAKGPRDRRVRLAAHTAIQFYDVQDRLGYDRPSKAVDWLIKKAKSAIDELAQLPPWTPSATTNHKNTLEQQQQQIDELAKQTMENMVGGEEDEPAPPGLTHQSNHEGSNSSFLPPSLDSDAIADTIKSFFPMGASAEASSSGMQFPAFPTTDLLSRSGSHSQDLRLSLQSFQDPIMLHHHHHHHHQHEQAHVLLSGTPLGFENSGWAEAAELSRLHRLAAWNNAGGGGGGDSAGGSGGAAAGYMFNTAAAAAPAAVVAAPQPLLQQLLGHNQFFATQRGPLQSSNTPSIRAWMDPAAADHHHQTSQPHPQQHNHHPGVVPVYPSSFSGIGFASGVGGFSGFHIPARIQGDEEEHDGYSDKPSSASSDSRH